MQELLKRFNELLIAKNEVINLTAHKTIESSWQNNIIDSLLFTDYFPKACKMLDLGSGCGCPAIPLKISLPELNVTLIDSVNKKIEFLNETVRSLSLQNISAIHTRIEDYAQKHREAFDIVTARAVAELPTLLEYAIPFLKVGGKLFAYKGKNYQEEIEKSKFALKELGAEVIANVSQQPSDDITRHLIIIGKTRPTPVKYPRGKNLPRLKPL